MSYNDIGDKELIYLLRNGNVDAKNILIERYRKRMFGIINAFVKRNNLKNIDYEDLAGECFIVFLKCLEKYDEEYNFYLYVLESVERTLIKISTKEGQYQNILSLDEGIGEQNTAYINDSSYLYRENVINDMIESFNPVEQDIINLRLKGYNYNEISKIIGVNKKKIYKQNDMIKEVLRRKNI